MFYTVRLDKTVRLQEDEGEKLDEKNFSLNKSSMFSQDDSIVVIPDAMEQHLNEPIRALRFHANCTTLVTASASAVCLFDVRKAKLLQRLPFGGKNVNNIRLFGASSKYLLVCADACHVYYQEGKEYTLVKTFAEHTDLVMDGVLQEEAGQLISVGLDRELKIFAGGE